MALKANLYLGLFFNEVLWSPKTEMSKAFHKGWKHQMTLTVLGSSSFVNAQRIVNFWGELSSLNEMKGFSGTLFILSSHKTSSKHNKHFDIYILLGFTSRKQKRNSAFGSCEEYLKCQT